MASNRRSFLARLGAATAALALPRPAAARGAAGAPPVVPPGALTPEFWAELRGQFLIPQGEAFFNTGTLGSSPRVVLDAVVEHMTHVDRDIAHWDYKEGHENYFTGYYPEDGVRTKVAALLNADHDEIALTQNATFGMNFMANGLELSPSDEVVVMEGAHAGGRCGWELRDHRYGPTVRHVRVPVPPDDPAQLIDLWEAATTPRTRVWAIPHLTSGTAILFPVDEMCRRARERGIISVVDGAQTFGHLAVDVRTMGADAWFTSPHKWLLAPKGTGVLYVRRELLEGLWPTLAS
ncbi:MAG TPA: aminotransferase class V-fold PLP-dependent enzyme, partial [Longimicrobiales bacterium]|nr:aminotransferase class V-fold PLP-dependent enzyme [Longimicrobiales bacterium]